ncbi:MAG: formate--tetrahydrofolate ligase [Rhodospirillaceae bacterium]|nr:formate--tetrahydrofolate ligase [Rhodospirillaceae bacterium]
MKNGQKLADGPVPIDDIAGKLGIPADVLITFGGDKAKIPLSYVDGLAPDADGKLILVAAMTPTKYGEGKTTTSIGLGDGLNRLGEKVAICLREPSLGPVFGMKGGGTGGGKSQIIPSADINLHFTGDLHAISSAHNLLSAIIDNHLYWDNKLDIDRDKITWPRVMDMNDRALRKVTHSMNRNGADLSHSGRFDITAASEVMAIFSLSRDTQDLQRRLGNIVVAQDCAGNLITAKQLDANGAMAALLKDAINPNLVQTLEGTPCLVHGGPFANIAHGCSSVIATRAGLKMADYVFTEAGFGADLGAEKFFDIKCRSAGIRPNAVIIVATIRALKAHGGIALADIELENAEAVLKGAENLNRQVENTRSFGVPVMVALNQFASDSAGEVTAVAEYCGEKGIPFGTATHFVDGGEGTMDLARKVIEISSNESEPKYCYPLDASVEDKLKAVATKIYGAADIALTPEAQQKLENLERLGKGGLPVCIAKTQYSFSTDPKALGVPQGHIIEFNDFRLNGGAEFIVAIAGNMMTMPGLPREPAANKIGLDENGEVTGII